MTASPSKCKSVCLWPSVFQSTLVMRCSPHNMPDCSKLKHFLKYMKRNRDDSPLYIFDSGFDEDRLAKKILSKSLLL